MCFFYKDENGRDCVGRMSELYFVLCLLGQRTVKDPAIRLGAVGGNGFKANVETPHLDKTYR